MEQRVRERIALVVFVLLLAFAGIVLFSYFSTGRSWTIAATFVDDKVGGMDGYMAIVYSGTMEKETSEAVSGQDGAKLSVSTTGTPDRSFDGSTDGSIDDGPEESLDGSTDGVLLAQAPPVQRSIVGQESTPTSSFEESETSILADTIGLRILSLYPRLIHERYDGVFVSDVRDLYERKGADVITISLSTPSPYAEPTIVSSRGRSIGIYALTSYINRLKLAEYLTFFKESEVDIVVCVTPRLSLLPDGRDTDVIIVTEPLSAGTVSPEAFSDTSLVLEDPEVGDVGVILFSLNMVPASRIISAL